MSAHPSSATPSDPEAGRAAMPASVRVSVGVLGGLAVLLVLSALVTVVARTAVVDALVQAGSYPRSTAERVVLINLAQSAAFGLLSGVSAVFLARGRSWARWTGLVGSALLALVTLGATVLTGGVSISAQLVLVLCVAAAASLLTPATAAWARAGARSRSRSAG